MNNIEEDLRRALRRQDPAGDFVGKVIGRIASGEGLEPEEHTGSDNVVPFRRKPRVMVWLATAAAAACLVGLFVTRSYMNERGKVPGADSGSVSAEKMRPGSTNPPRADGVPSTGDIQSGGPAEHDKVAVVSKKLHGGARYNRGAGRHPLDEARRAEEQLKLALAITSAKLGYAQRSIQEADGSSGPDRAVNR